MPFIIPSGINGCKCCTEILWNCKNCFEKWHNGGPHGAGDYIPPKWYGQTMGDVGLIDTLLDIKRTIKEDKNRKYREYEYGH